MLFLLLTLFFSLDWELTEVFFFTFSKSVSHIGTPRVQQAEKKCLFSKIISSIETVEVGIADTEYRGETKLSKTHVIYSISFALLRPAKASCCTRMNQLSFCWCRAVTLGSFFTIPVPAFLCWIMSFLSPESSSLLGQFFPTAFWEGLHGRSIILRVCIAENVYSVLIFDE